MKRKKKKMALDAAFDKVVVISADVQRFTKTVADLAEKKLSENVTVEQAILGKDLRPPAWWKAGDGAWGCLCSHRRALEAAYLDGVSSVCIIEDDAVWQPDAAELLEDFMKQVPKDWGQIYLGGQHTKTPIWVNDAVLRGVSVNRTHAYVANRNAIPKILAHIQHAPDYMMAVQNGGKARHIDHQLEVAHQRKDWPVYAPSWWLCGQRANWSQINGRVMPEQWWHYNWGDWQNVLPLVVVSPGHKSTNEEASLLWYGDPKNRIDGTRVDAGVLKAGDDDDALRRVLSLIGREAFRMERLPAIESNNFARIKRIWPSAVRRRGLGYFDLESLRIVRAISTFEHRWKKVKL